MASIDEIRADGRLTRELAEAMALADAEQRDRLVQLVTSPISSAAASLQIDPQDKAAAAALQEGIAKLIRLWLSAAGQIAALTDSRLLDVVVKAVSGQGTDLLEADESTTSGIRQFLFEFLAEAGY